MSKKNNKLKAYIMYDGDNRAVPSSVVHRAKMPKVGKWVEIPMYYNSTVATTTTTTTASGGTTAIQAYYAGFSTPTGCDVSGLTPVDMYVTGGTTFEDATEIWTDPSATTPAQNGWWIPGTLSGIYRGVTNGAFVQTENCV